MENIPEATIKEWQARFEAEKPKLIERNGPGMYYVVSDHGVDGPYLDQFEPMILLSNCGYPFVVWSAV